MATRAFTCTATHDGNGWVAHCDQLPGISTAGRTLIHNAKLQRHAVAGRLQISAEDVIVEVRPVLPGPVHEHLNRAAELRETAARANYAAAVETRAAVRILVNDGLSLRDVGTILGVSVQRAHQLLHTWPQTFT